MDFQDVVRRRRMVRRYADRPVDRAVVDRALANAVRAPSAGFSQGWAFVVLDTPPDVRRFWEAASEPGALDEPGRWLAGMTTAPVVVLPCTSRTAYLDRYAEPDKGFTDRSEARWPVPYWYVDAGMAALLVLQTVVDEGLGACLFGIPPERGDAVRAAFGVDPAFEPIGAITIGHPHPDDLGARGSPSRRPRTPVGEVVHRGRWRT